MHARTLNETEPQAKIEFSDRVYYEHLASESENALSRMDRYRRMICYRERLWCWA